jgi:metal-dependent amidase/aminoacylase/carboxypeptidase family protein
MDASAGRKFDECWLTSEMHPRRRAVRVVMMAVVAMVQHDNLGRLGHAHEPVNGRDHIRAADFSIVTIQILHGSLLTLS